MDVPTHYQLFNPTLDALRALGGSGSIDEIAKRVIQQGQFTDYVIQQLHGEGPQTELEYRLAWARTYLKSYGMVINSSRGVWALTEKGSGVESVEPNAVLKFVRESYSQSKNEASAVSDLGDDLDLDVDSGITLERDEDWRRHLLNVIRNMDPTKFERLCQRLLRESGFIDVEVTGRSGDGGIDGRGIIRFAGLIGFPVLFQCKRYSGNSTVTPSQIRDFRGAMTGRADRGLIITTGGFTQEAQREATRDGAPPIDLINGDLLVEKLKDLELGVSVSTRQIEVVSIDEDWFVNV